MSVISVRKLIRSLSILKERDLRENFRPKEFSIVSRYYASYKEQARKKYLRTNVEHIPLSIFEWRNVTQKFIMTVRRDHKSTCRRDNEIFHASLAQRRTITYCDYEAYIASIKRIKDRLLTSAAY